MTAEERIQVQEIIRHTNEHQESWRELRFLDTATGLLEFVQ
jgi:hypothetical protein